MKNDYFIQSKSSDISFCGSICQNTACSRCTDPDAPFWGAVRKNARKGEWFSFSDFSEDCKSFLVKTSIVVN